MEKGNLLFTIGSARCDKSTYCNMLRKKFCEEFDKELVIVAGDDIRLNMHGERFNRDCEPMVWAVHTYMVKTLLYRGYDVIIDGTNTTKDSLWRILNININAFYILIDTSVEECERRAIESGHLDLVENGVIRRHAEQLQKLKDEGLDKVVDDMRARVIARWRLADAPRKRDAYGVEAGGVLRTPGAIVVDRV